MSDEPLRALYAAFNARDIEAVLAALAEDVDWPNAWEGGRLRGRAAVRGYWTRQWAEIEPRVEPTHIVELPDGRVAVDVRQTVGDRSSAVRHIYTLRDGLVTRMDVVPHIAPSAPVSPPGERRGETHDGPGSG